MSVAGYGALSANDSWVYYGLNTNNQVWESIIMPEDGTITSLSCYFGGNGSSVSARLCLWDSSGNLLRQSSQFSQPAGSYTTNGQSWATYSINSYSASNGQQLFVGFWRDPAGGHILSYDSGAGGSFAMKYAASPTGTSGSSSIGGKATFFATYSPSSPPPPPPPSGGVKIWNGSSWQKHPVKVWNGSSWVWRPVKEWNGSSWVRRA